MRNTGYCPMRRIKEGSVYHIVPAGRAAALASFEKWKAQGTPPLDFLAAIKDSYGPEVSDAVAPLFKMSDSERWKFPSLRLHDGARRMLPPKIAYFLELSKTEGKLADEVVGALSERICVASVGYLTAELMAETLLGKVSLTTLSFADRHNLQQWTNIVSRSSADRFHLLNAEAHYLVLNAEAKAELIENLRGALSAMPPSERMRFITAVYSDAVPLSTLSQLAGLDLEGYLNSYSNPDNRSQIEFQRSNGRFPALPFYELGVDFDANLVSR